MAEVTEIEKPAVAEGAAPVVSANPADNQNPPSGDNPPAGAPPKSFTVAEILSEHGITEDELKEFRDQKKAKEEEENKPKIETQRWLDVLSHGVKSGALTKDDALMVEDLSKKSDRDIVFAEFAKTVANPDNLEGDELQEYLEDEFADTYSTHNKSEAANKKRELLFKTEAEQIRNESLSKIKNVEKEFTKSQLAASLTNQHKTLFAEITAKPISQSFKVNNDDIVIEVPNTITEEEVTKSLKSDEGKSLLNFMGMVHAENPEAAAEIYKNFVTSLSTAKIEEAKTEAIWNKAVEYAKKAFSIGATAAFNSKENKQVASKGGTVMTKAEAEQKLQSGQRI